MMLDYIIVGLGLGGASMAFRLEEAGKAFIVIEDNSQKSSRVAGGLINPVILKRFTLAWKANEQLDRAIGFYQRLETHLNERFLFPLEIYRKFSGVEEQNNWFMAADQPGLSPYLDTSLKSSVNEAIPADFSFGRVLQTGKIEPGKFLGTYGARLQEQGKLEKARFEHDQLKIFEDHVNYKGIAARKIIFCEGFGLRENPFFNYLPLVGNKGEYLIIRAPDLKLEVAVKSSVFIFPEGNDLYKVGATYDNSDKSATPTPQARKDLLKKLNQLIETDYEVVDQVAGIRPSTADRRPLVGQHPEFRNLYCCNGFGSRGILLAPTVSGELLDLMEKGEPVPPETDLGRFTKRRYRTK